MATTTTVTTTTTTTVPPMERTFYSTDEDIEKIRPNILELGVSDWLTQHEESFAIVNRTLIGKWYINVAIEYGLDYREVEFDPNLVDIDQVRRLASYKALELIYLYLMKDSPEADGFEREMSLFRNRYNDELLDLLAIGINYDWDEDGIVDASEKYVPQMRRLHRA
jgi:hypothetical protein